MKIFFLAAIAGVFASLASLAETIDLFILAGQSNAQGWMGEGTSYPDDPNELDQSIRFYWVTPRHGSSGGEWTHLKAQPGRFTSGHFGLEVTFARALKEAGGNPAIFKYSLGSTSIARDWGAPGDGKMYDQMAQELRKAFRQLRDTGHQVMVRGFIWIQGESDAENEEMAAAYELHLGALIEDLRENVVGNPDLAVILGVDEQHPWVRARPQVVSAQKNIAAADDNTVFTSMIGLTKADSTHLTPSGLEEHGRRIYAAYSELIAKECERQQ